MANLYIPNSIALRNFDSIFKNNSFDFSDGIANISFHRSYVLGHDWKPLFQNEVHVGDEPYPFPAERMKPLPYEAKEGRANPKGIPYLYLATNKETAMAESRPWLGAYISVAQFKIKRDITLVDCSRMHGNDFIFDLQEPTAQNKEESVWFHIDKAFSSPITISDSVADYIPTQIIAELFKNNGFDGIFYKSNFGKGHNFVLFDIDIAEMKNCSLFQTDKINFSFTEAYEQYFVRSRKEKDA